MLRNKLFGDLSPIEAKKFSLLACMFFFTIGAVWLLDPLKDGIFFHTVGSLYQPNAKLNSLIIVLIMVFIFGKLVDIVKKQTLFYIYGIFYAVVFILLAYFLGHPTIGLANKTLGIHRWIGWVVYFSIESFTSMTVGLFWAFATSITDSESAKKGFPLIIVGGQLGGILGIIFDIKSNIIGVQNIFYIAAISSLLIVVSVMVFMRVMPLDELYGTKQDVITEVKPKTSFLEGLKLSVTRPYLFGIFIIVSLNEMLATMIQYQLKMQAHLLPEYSTSESLTRFGGFLGLFVNGLALITALFGTSYFMRRFGLKFCLLILPSILVVAVAGLYFQSITPGFSSMTLLWATFIIVLISKGLTYALNNPAKEILYIPTSKDAKFKAKSWIDGFGYRFASAASSGINKAMQPILLNSGMASFIETGALISLGMVGVWIVAALYLSKKFAALTKEGKVIE